MSFHKLVELVIVALFTCVVTILWDMNKSIQQINANVAVVLTTQNNQAEQMRDHESRIRGLELKKR